jgi:hypothetical protein
MIVVLVSGFPIFPKWTQNWHMIGSTLWMGDNWLGLKAFNVLHLTWLLIADNDMPMLDNPDFFSLHL